MARVIFWDVDTQYDFMHADGKLYVPEAERIIANLQRLTDYAHGHGIRVVASADDHVMGHPEISDQPDWQRPFPPHCMRGPPGQKKIPETALRDPLVIEPARADAKALPARLRAHQRDVRFHKHRFAVFANENVPRGRDVLAPALAHDRPRTAAARVLAVFSARSHRRPPRGPRGHAAADDRTPLGSDGAAARRDRSTARPAVSDFPPGARGYHLGDRLHGD